MPRRRPLPGAPDHLTPVVHVIDSLAIGGAERLAVDLANGLADRGRPVHLVATRGAGPLLDDVATGVTVHDLARRSRFDLAGLRRFRRLVRDLSPGIVHAHGWSSLQFATAALAGRRRGPALVFHDHRPVGLAALPRSYRVTAWPRTRAHLAVDDDLLHPPLRTRHRAIREVVPNGIPVDRYRVKVHGAVSDPASIVVVANLRPQKGHLVLADAIAALVATGTRLRVDLVGATDDQAHRQACEDRLAELGLSVVVRICGPRTDVATLLADYDLGVLASTTESGPLALIEYLAAGLPFVVTEVGEVPRSLPPDFRRWLVPADDAPTLAARIAEALAVPVAEREALAEQGRTFARHELSLERTIALVEDVYRQLGA